MKGINAPLLALRYLQEVGQPVDVPSFTMASMVCRPGNYNIETDFDMERLVMRGGFVLALRSGVWYAETPKRSHGWKAERIKLCEAIMAFPPDYKLEEFVIMREPNGLDYDDSDRSLTYKFSNEIRIMFRAPDSYVTQ